MSLYAVKFYQGTRAPIQSEVYSQAKNSQTIRHSVSIRPHFDFTMFDLRLY